MILDYTWLRFNCWMETTRRRKTEDEEEGHRHLLCFWEQRPKLFFLFFLFCQSNLRFSNPEPPPRWQTLTRMVSALDTLKALYIKASAKQLNENAEHPPISKLGISGSSPSLLGKPEYLFSALFSLQHPSSHTTTFSGCISSVSRQQICPVCASRYHHEQSKLSRWSRMQQQLSLADLCTPAAAGSKLWHVLPEHHPDQEPGSAAQS